MIYDYFIIHSTKNFENQMRSSDFEKENFINTACFQKVEVAKLFRNCLDHRLESFKIIIITLLSQKIVDAS